MNLSENQKSALRGLLQSPQWRIVLSLADEYIKRVAERPGLLDTEWESIKQMCLKEGEVQGIRNFLQEVFNSIE
jgi:hypothetical protein